MNGIAVPSSGMAVPVRKPPLTAYQYIISLMTHPHVRCISDVFAILRYSEWHKICVTRVRNAGSWLGYGLDNRGILVGFPTGEGDFPLLRRSPPFPKSSQLRIQWVAGALPLKIKWLLVPSSAEVKNEWVSSPSYAFMGWTRTSPGWSEEPIL